MKKSPFPKSDFILKQAFIEYVVCLFKIYLQNGQKESFIFSVSLYLNLLRLTKVKKSKIQQKRKIQCHCLKYYWHICRWYFTVIRIVCVWVFRQLIRTFSLRLANEHRKKRKVLCWAKTETTIKTVRFFLHIYNESKKKIDNVVFTCICVENMRKFFT